MAHVTLDASYLRTARHAPDHVRRALARFIGELGELPTPTPLPGDLEVLIPPARRWWRHAIAASGWSVHYTAGADGFVVRSVAQDR